MIDDVRNREPAWWLLYSIVLLLGGTLWLVETSVPIGAARTVLEIAAVIALFTSMMSWVRYNRVAIRLVVRVPAVRARDGPGAKFRWYLRRMQEVEVDEPIEHARHAPELAEASRHT